MAQPVPKVTEQDIQRLVDRDFPSRADEVHSILRQYGPQPWHNEALRVRAAILRLADGDLTRLESALETAKSDYRDALATAEYPEMFRAGFRDTSKFTPDQLAEIEARDWQQYRDWFDR